MPALRSLMNNLSGTLTPQGALQSNLFYPGVLPRVSSRLNLKLPEFLPPTPRRFVRGEGFRAFANLKPMQTFTFLIH